MGMLTGLRRWLSGGERKAATGFQVGQWICVSRSELGEGIDAGDPKAYQLNAWVYACVNAISQAVATAPIVV